MTTESLILILIGVGFSLGLLLVAGWRLSVRAGAFTVCGLHLLGLGLAIGWSGSLPSDARALQLSREVAGFQWAFLVDGLGIFLLAIISLVGVFVTLFSARYFSDPAAFRRGVGLLHLFAVAMVGLVFSDNLLAMFIFWELTTLISFFLITFDGDDAGAIKAGTRALIVTVLGGLCLLASFIMLGHVAGTFRFSELQSKASLILESSWIGPIVVTFLVGCLTKSALIPFHYWLPGAMKAPAPVSAYLHSAAMVKAGLFLLLRFCPIFAGSEWFAAPLVTLGLLTALWGVFCSFGTSDLKQFLAFTTVSALGTIAACIGWGQEAGIRAALALFLAHALYKSGLFIVAGDLESALGHRDLGRLRSQPSFPWPGVVGCALMTLSMMGLPPTLGFIAKETLLQMSLVGEGGASVGRSVFFLGLTVLLGALTLAAAARLMLALWPRDRGWGRFAGLRGMDVLLLAGVGVASAVFAPTLSVALIEPALAAVVPGASAQPLALWHGVSPAVVASLVAIALGVGLTARHSDLARFATGVLRALPRTEDLHDRVLQGLLRLGHLQTQWLFPAGERAAARPALLGSFAVLALGIGAALPDYVPGDFVFFSDLSVADLGVICLAVFAVGILFRVRSGLHAVLSAGLSGLGVILIFVVYSAPDLAMTQLMVETFVLVVLAFFLAGRRLETRQGGWFHNLLSYVVPAGLAGVMVLGLFLIPDLDMSQRVSTEMVGRSWLEAHGANVVNVILVDFRGMDTFGEALVLGISALAGYSLFQLNRGRA
jgi:multicomponent Na+:H+ antiporter subunit A